MRIDRYIIKEFLGTYLFMIILILAIAIVFDINEKIDKFIKNNVPLEEIIYDYYLNFVPYYANLFSHIFVFLTVILFTSKFATNSEIIAMLSSGIRFRRLMIPYMISATIIATASFILSGFIIPPSNKTRIDFENKYIDSRNKVTYDNQIQFMVAPGTIVYFGDFNLETNTGGNFSIDRFDSLQLVSRLTASSVRYDSAYRWKVSDYQIRNFEGSKERIITGTELDTMLRIVPNDFVMAKFDHQMLTTPQLRKHIENGKERGLGNIQPFEVEYHSRFAAIASAFILTVIGASISARKVKGGRGLHIGSGLILSIAYIFFMTVSSSFAVKGNMSPFLAAWIPNIVFAGIAYFLYRKTPN